MIHTLMLLPEDVEELLMGGQLRVTDYQCAESYKEVRIEDEQKKLKILEFLLNEGCPIATECEKGQTALMQAASSNYPHLIVELLKHNKTSAFVNKADGKGKTALYFAQLHHSEDSEILLREVNAIDNGKYFVFKNNLNRDNKDEVLNALTKDISSATPKTLTALKYVIQQKKLFPNINYRHSQSKQTLFFNVVVKANNLEMAKFLHEDMGADIMIKGYAENVYGYISVNPNGRLSRRNMGDATFCRWTPLMQAVTKPHNTVVEYLCEKMTLGGLREVDEMGSSAINIANSNGNIGHKNKIQAQIVRKECCDADTGQVGHRVFRVSNINNGSP